VFRECEVCPYQYLHTQNNVYTTNALLVSGGKLSLCTNFEVSKTAVAMDYYTICFDIDTCLFFCQLKLKILVYIFYYSLPMLLYVWSGARIPVGAENISVLQNIQTGSGPTGPPVQWIPGFFSGGQVAAYWCWPFTYSADVKNMWSYTSFLPICVHGMDRNNFTFIVSTSLNRPGIESRWGRDFPHLSRPALRSILPPLQWVPSLSRG
jgi:hypothetical protein